MFAEYKRDVSHNYLILHGDETINTTSYQVRILTGNIMSHAGTGWNMALLL